MDMFQTHTSPRSMLQSCSFMQKKTARMGGRTSVRNLTLVYHFLEYFYVVHAPQLSFSFLEVLTAHCVDTKDGIIMEKKFPPGDNSAIPVVRGRGIIKDLSAPALLSAILQPSVRHLWDARFESGALLERYARRTYKFYSVQKGVGWIVSERDIVGVQTVIFSTEEDPSSGYEVVQTSVEGDPENKGRVRATLTCAGWSVVPRGEDLEVSYVVKSEFDEGWIY
jgi:hypothetical protein